MTNEEYEEIGYKKAKNDFHNLVLSHKTRVIDFIDELKRKEEKENGKPKGYDYYACLKMNMEAIYTDLLNDIYRNKRIEI